MPTKLPLSAIERQMLSVMTAVKNGITAVIKRSAFLFVHSDEKQAIAAQKRNTGMNMLENPYTETSISPSEKNIVLRPGPEAPKSSA
jgi:hypothetical protein